MNFACKKEEVRDNFAKSVLERKKEKKDMIRTMGIANSNINLLLVWDTASPSIKNKYGVEEIRYRIWEVQ